MPRPAPRSADDVMLFLLFQLGNNRYALDASRVVEVVPLVTLQELPRAPHGVAGVFNYRGQPVPAVDLCALTTGRPARPCLSTRIIVVRHPAESGPAQLLGLIVERATEMMRRDPGDFRPLGVGTDAAPFLGPGAPDGCGWIQWVQADLLLSDGVRAALFRQLPDRPQSHAPPGAEGMNLPGRHTSPAVRPTHAAHRPANLVELEPSGAALGRTPARGFGQAAGDDAAGGAAGKARSGSVHDAG